MTIILGTGYQRVWFDLIQRGDYYPATEMYKCGHDITLRYDCDGFLYKCPKDWIHQYS